MPKLIPAMLLLPVSLLLMGDAMALFNKEPLILFSEVQGVVLDQGRPVAGAQVERVYNWGWKDRTYRETTTTDSEGRFHFAATTESTLLGSVLPHEPVIIQEIFIRRDGREYEGWMYTKHNYRADGELDRPIQLTCRLEAEPDFQGESKVYGICSFQ